MSPRSHFEGGMGGRKSGGFSLDTVNGRVLGDLSTLRGLGVKGDPKPRPFTVCPCCGNTFQQRKATGKAQYCSHKCANASTNTRRVETFKANVAARKAAEPVKYRTCNVCQSKFVKKWGKTCSPACASAAVSAKLTRPPCTCKGCGAQFQQKRSNSAGLYCSRECFFSTIRKNETPQPTKFAHRSGNARRRAKLAGVEYQPVRPIDVFERDAWVCKLCGEPTLKEARGTHHPRAPEVDHVVPLAKGGPHVFANLQTAHRACNRLKGDAHG